MQAAPPPCPSPRLAPWPRLAPSWPVPPRRQSQQEVARPRWLQGAWLRSMVLLPAPALALLPARWPERSPAEKPKSPWLLELCGFGHSSCRHSFGLGGHVIRIGTAGELLDDVGVQCLRGTAPHQIGRRSAAVGCRCGPDQGGWGKPGREALGKYWAAVTGPMKIMDTLNPRNLNNISRGASRKRPTR